MNTRAGAFAILIGGALFAQDLHFKTRTLHAVSRPEAPPDANAASVPEPGSHRIIQFDHTPGVEDLDALVRDGLPPLAAVPDNAVLVAAPRGEIPPRSGVKWIGSIPASDKLSPELDLANMGDADVATVIVEFHSDISADQQEGVAESENLTLLRPAVLRPDHVIVKGSAAQLIALSLHDEVGYVFPADPALLTDTNLIPCAGMLTMSGVIGQYANIVHGWDLDADHAAHLGYAFGSITPKVPAATVQSEVIRALNEWSRQTNVIFQPAVRASSPRTVLIKFISGAHGDPWPFDGPGGTLAHTFYPVPINAESIAGDMHLDADENWHAGGDIDIYSVALHEAGHAIGLGHSDKPGDVMYPYYRSRSTLSANDIGAAQTLYGVLNASAPVTLQVTSGTPSTPPSPLRLVLDSIPPTSQLSSIALTGTLSGGRAPWSVQWQTDHGYSGKASFQNSGTTETAWIANGIPLLAGANTLTVTAFDSLQKTTTQTVSLSLQPQQTSIPGGTPVSIRIDSPASTVTTLNTQNLSVAGTASGGTGVTRVTWQTAAGASGIASGTDHWLAQGIPMLMGTNTVILRAWDAKGANAWAAVVAVRH